MTRFTVYRICGYISVVIGILATLSISRPQLLYYGIALSIPGFALAMLNIVTNAKYEYEDVKYPAGYLGLFFSSLPVLFFLLMIYKWS
jgi:hypothetical protein